jgi:hypothetical protein
MLACLTQGVKNALSYLSSAANRNFRRVTQPARPNIGTGTLADLPRSCAGRLAENVLLRQQLVVLHRPTKTPLLTW